MPRATITIDSPALNAGTALSAGGTADANNGHTVPLGKSRRLLLMIREGTSTAGTWTILAGTANAAGDRTKWSPKAGQGNLVITPGASTTQVVVVESARFAQSDGAIYVDVNSVPGTRTISAVRLPAVA